MSDEIKEILDYLHDKDNYIEELGVAYKRIYINNGDLKILLDYITNLQNTKEYLGEVLHEQDLELEDYKSRCEKAIEYIKNCPEYLWANVNTKVLSNILNGRSDKEMTNEEKIILLMK